MNIKVYTGFTKRRNSTKVPSSGGTQKTVTLKEGTSIENPTFLLAGDLFTVDYVEAFGHYYFVDDVVSVRNGLTEIKCSMDSLASHKSEIGSYNAYVERSATFSYAKLPDPEVSIMNLETVLSNTVSTLGIFHSSGYFMLSVINSKGSGSGFTCYYLMGITQIEYIAQYCMNNWDSGSTDIIDWIQSTVLKTGEALVDCKWIPLSIAAFPSGTATYETVQLGKDNLPSCSAYRIDAVCVATESITVSIPHTYTDFRKGAPYSIGKVFIPCYGVVDFNPLDFDDDNIYMQFDADMCTGDVVCYMKNSGGKLISSYTYNVAVSCPVGRLGGDITSTTTGIISTGAGIATTIATHGAAATVASGISTGASGINALASAISPTMSMRGAAAGRAIAQHGTDIICVVIEKTTSDPDDLNDTHGKPLMQKIQISTSPGYLKCSNASVPIAGMAAERDEVNSFLNNGFYYE